MWLMASAPFLAIGPSAGMPALGEGETCDYCAARGICRKDHWSEA